MKEDFTYEILHWRLDWSMRTGVDSITKFPGLVILLVDMFVWKYSTSSPPHHIPQECSGSSWEDFKAFYNTKTLSPSTSSGQLPIPCMWVLCIYYMCDICAPGDFIFWGELSGEGAFQCAECTPKILHFNFSFRILHWRDKSPSCRSRMSSCNQSICYGLTQEW